MISYNKNDPESIQKMFDSIAKDYDRTNGILSLQMHKRWNATLIQHVLEKQTPKVFLDLCCGTGAIALNYLAKTPQATKAYLLDFSQHMLTCAKEIAASLPIQQHHIEFLKADAQAIPLPDSSIESACVAYGMRNIKNPSQCIEEVARVLAPGGLFGILELTQPKNPIIRWGHKMYLKLALPLIGKLMTSNKEAYQYLSSSIHSFISPREITLLLQKHGFQDIYKKYFMFGAATLFIAKKRF